MNILLIFAKDLSGSRVATGWLGCCVRPLPPLPRPLPLLLMEGPDEPRSLNRWIRSRKNNNWRCVPSAQSSTGDFYA